MERETMAAIRVHYRTVEDYHVFTSDDVYGLYVASKDPAKAMNGVCPALEKLVRLNHGINCKVVPADSFKEMLQLLGTTTAPRPNTIGSRTFVMQAPEAHAHA